MEDQTFHRSVSRILFFSQFFAVLPVSNIRSSNIYRVHYSWMSFPVLITAIVFLLNSLEFLMLINLLLIKGFSFYASGSLLFFLVCLSEHLLFWRLAIKWPRICKIWRRTEQIFLRTPYRLYCTFNMNLAIKFFGGLILLNAFLEHCLFLWNAMHNSELQREQCNLTHTFWENLYRRERTHLFHVLSWRLWMLPTLEYINLSMAYVRSFSDAFITCVSIGLAARFRQLYLRIEAVRRKTMPDIFWIEIRQDYLALKNLVRLLNNEISLIIVVACCNNMNFICLQLFNSFKNIGGDTITTIIFWYSLMFVIMRTLVTLFAASAIHDVTIRILATLRDVPSKSWTLEVQRFGEQLSVDITALSGRGFFFLTRKMIFAMASTVVTYEVVMAQVVDKGSNQEIDICFL